MTGEKWPVGKIPSDETPICIVFPSESDRDGWLKGFAQFLCYDSDNAEVEYWLLQGRTIEARIAERKVTE